MCEEQTSKKISQCFGKPHPKTQFTQVEDQQLMKLVQYYGDKNWDIIAHIMGNRNSRQCHDRYVKYLSPGLNKNPWTPEEDVLLIKKYQEIGAKWVMMSKYFNNRTDYSLKNRWKLLRRHNCNVIIFPISEPEGEKENENESSVENVNQVDEVNQLMPDFEFAFDFDF
ncbi:Myb-like DNA-binding domain containing protein [Trichomonas vaginalis G3]|uniref:Myb-like DNA-binding domain containing protein n=1 Tax=Trichomonas vaginalis (strain ATCC PRA-98 / G3) TaxID=412133 RepID=A2ELF9_TRIV3|nr:RNA polymerase II transcription regulator recruiting protein [Trichomonas vaginalis G3]EAY06486.1 Myb-like DNA-binding domain containing protein [Trichomonas vaginalis G3]KAI5538882.1 RNA polymerase II transcription regulator recruiting protein [Trichomonas vaginalis G3]|eukprot:XP_001318709.1 Myb-like DNA-binding domain containing protein [Trichomonas vaginalis G3]